MPQYVQYGCGLSAPAGWMNFDSSPTLRFQKVPLLGSIFRKKVDFPSNVIYGDILKTLPGVFTNSCDGVYCSHVLEHLSLQDFRVALQNTFSILKKDGIFRCVLPDLEVSVSNYIKRKSEGDKIASIKFLQDTLLGVKERPRGIRHVLMSIYGNSHHLWMWDKDSLQFELDRCGFKNIRSCTFNDSPDEHFKLVEDSGRFHDAIALEAKK